jgi:hypothetical protein
MNRKNDDLLRLAFGELSADAAQSVEAQAAADPAIRRELEAYRNLRAGLQHLPPPPPDGLSTERLRAAILDRELKTRRPAFGAFAWAPVALAAVAAFVFFSRSAPQGSPTIVADTDGPSYKTYIKAPTFTAQKPVAIQKANVVPPSVKQVASRSASDEAEVLPAVTRRRERSARVAASVPKVAYGPAPKAEGDEKLPKFALNPTPETIAPPSSVVSKDPGRVATNSDDTVVIISTQRDLDTGAHAASETEAGSVLVGG